MISTDSLSRYSVTEMHDTSRQQIAVVRSSYSPYGGAETLALSVISELLRRGIKVHLLTWPQQGWPLSHSNLKIVPLGSRHGNRLWRLWLFEQSVKKYLASHGFERIFSIDLVSEFTHMHAGGGSHQTFLRIKNQHSSAFTQLFRKASLFHAYTIHLQKKGFSNPRLAGIHCCSRMVAEDIQRDYEVPSSKITVIYNGMNWERMGDAFLTRTELAEKLSQQYGLNLDNEWVLFLGTGFFRKGLDIAIRGLRYMPESYHLMVIGSDKPHPFRNMASKYRVDHRVHFLGPKERGWRFASLCKALVLPSRYEPFGLAAAEAQAMGLPVLVSDRTGYAEIIVDGKTGVIVPVTSTEKEVERAFSSLLSLVEKPAMSAGQIRESVKGLDQRIILNKLICEFLEL